MPQRHRVVGGGAVATQPEVKAGAGFGAEPLLEVARPLLQAEPGGAAQTVVTLKHGGVRVEGFHLDVVGLPPSWWRVEPPLLELLPGTSGTALVELRPPAGTPAPDAPLPFGVRATSALDASRGVVEEGDLEVGRQLSLTAEISPLTSRARWRGRHVVTFTNWGNAPIDLELTARDRDGRLGFLLAPVAVKVPIGGTASSRVKARIRHPVLRGKQAPAPFQVLATGPGVPSMPGAPPTVPPPGVPGAPGAGVQTLDAVVEPKAVLSNGVLVALGLVALLVVALVAWLVRLPGVVGATVPAADPRAPTQVKVTDFTGGRAVVTWVPDGNATHQVAAYQGDTAVMTVDAAPYASSAVVPLKDTKPGTRYCFAVAALDRDRSVPAKPVCEETQPADLLAPKVQDPKLVAGGALLTWPTTPGASYQVQSTGKDGAPDSSKPVTVQGGQTVVPVQPGLNCFVVQAIMNGRKSPFSQPAACANVDPAVVAAGQAGGGANPSGAPSGAAGSGGAPSGAAPTGAPSGVASSGAGGPGASANAAPLLTGYIVPVEIRSGAGVVDTVQLRSELESTVTALRAAGYTGAGWQLFGPPKYPLVPGTSYIVYASNPHDQVTATGDCSAVAKTAQLAGALHGKSCSKPIFIGASPGSAP